MCVTTAAPAKSIRPAAAAPATGTSAWMAAERLSAPPTSCIREASACVRPAPKSCVKSIFSLLMVLVSFSESVLVNCL